LILCRKIIFFIFLFSNLFPIDNLRHVKNITSLLSSTSIEPLDDEYLLVATTGGIYLSNYDATDLIDYTSNLEYANINTIAKNDDFIWLGGGDGNMQILDNNLNLESVIDYIPLDYIKEIIFYGDYAFAIASYENRDVIVQYSSDNNPSYLNYFSFDNFLIETENDIEQIINATVIYDILIQNDTMYLGTNEGLLQVDLSNYNNNLLLLLDWKLEDSTTDVASFVDGYNESPVYIVTEDGGTGINVNYTSTEIHIYPSDIRKSFYTNGSFYVLTNDTFLNCSADYNLPDFDVIFNLPDNIYSNFTDVEVINDDLYFTLENHGIIKSVMVNDSYISEYEYIIPNTLFSNKIIALDITSSNKVVGLGGEVDIGQGGFLIDNIINSHNINNFYSDGDNYEDLDNDDYYETYKYKYPNNFIAGGSVYIGENLSYISGDKNSESVKFDADGNFYFINEGIYLEPDIYHDYNPYNPIKDNIGYPKGLLHINSSDFSIIDSWDSIFTGIRYVSNGYNYVSLSQINMDNQNNLWIVNPYSEGDVNKPLVVNSNNTWIQIEDPSDDLYFLPEEIAFDNNNNVWIAYQKDDNENYSPGGIKIAMPTSNGGYVLYPPLSIVDESACYQYNDDLLLDDVSVWSIDIGSDQYGNTILWTLSDYGVMGYIINYIYSGYFNSLSLNIEPINCNFYFSDIPFNRFSKIRTDKQNNAWISSSSGLRMIKSNGEIGYNGQIINSINTELFSNVIYDIAFDDYGYVYLATDLGLSIFQSTFAEEQPVSNIAISPNPFIIGEHSELTITNLPSNSNIQIMNLSGRVLKEFSLQEETSILNWNGQSDRGRLLNTGIYLIAAINSSNGNIGVTKLAVIRK